MMAGSSRARGPSSHMHCCILRPLLVITYLSLHEIGGFAVLLTYLEYIVAWDLSSPSFLSQPSSSQLLSGTRRDFVDF